jgi:hypothetical protein
MKLNKSKWISSNLIEDLVNHNLLTFDMKDSSALYASIPQPRQPGGRVAPIFSAIAAVEII